MLDTMMTVFVRLHYSYKPGVISGDIGHNDDSISLSSPPVYMSDVILQILSSLCPTSPEFTPGL
jgi:hypothetical protein